MSVGRRFPLWILVVALVLAALVVWLTASRRPAPPAPAPVARRPAPHAHLDHAAYFAQPFESPQAVTRACLRCHAEAAREVMATAHWTWLGDSVLVPGHDRPQRIGKKNLLNNFCISASGNNVSCMKCHAGYGWADDSFDFAREENVDCLVCHERTGAYVKGDFGIPTPASDLLAAAKSVGFPRRENCGVCHDFGGGGQAVKHGDLDGRLDNPLREDDVHMGGAGFLCIDCHRSTSHRISGRAFSVSVEGANGVACADCHDRPPHADPRLNAHLSAVACETCHIGTYARKLATKTDWDWSKAGDPSRADDPHHYLRIKGEFLYGQDLVPEYAWFDRSVDRYLLGDRIDSATVTHINRPRGGIRDTRARIWPFKVHRGLQPYDRRHAVLLTPVTAGPGGYWHDFDWDQAFRLGSQATGLPYSGSYGWTRTVMYWPLAHSVAPKERSLRCDDCHGERGRMDWTALGYDGDPIRTGGRR